MAIESLCWQGKPVQAAGNWWGSGNGPNAPPGYTNPAGGLVSQMVDFTGWLPAEPAGIGQGAGCSP